MFAWHTIALRCAAHLSVLSFPTLKPCVKTNLWQPNPPRLRGNLKKYTWELIMAFLIQHSRNNFWRCLGLGLQNLWFKIMTSGIGSSEKHQFRCFRLVTKLCWGETRSSDRHHRNHPLVHCGSHKLGRCRSKFRPRWPRNQTKPTRPCCSLFSCCTNRKHFFFAIFGSSFRIF